MLPALRPALLLSLLAAALPAWAVQPFTADYRASVLGGITTDARMTLAPAGGDRWNYELVVNSPVASVRQATVFEERDGRWRPLSGQDTTQVLMKKSSKTATYDWARGEARWAGDVKPDRMGPVRLQEGDLDAMLLNLAIVRDAAAGRPLSYRMVDNGVARQQTYQVLGKETIVVAGKPREATKVSRSSDNKQVIAWVVPDLPVPVRILQKKDGKDELDLVLKSLR
ncbi:DUF3108 domain-containing protein [Thermomonas flagellata]|uniref:DUF3108 domain-containing protein n=1 Tax=Thermomonas flagellata TaxID=2888524 RepID=UPI001F047C04|nr:DUF3108 domain-containing protein [Thermomonas flagellata]